MVDKLMDIYVEKRIEEILNKCVREYRECVAPDVVLESETKQFMIQELLSLFEQDVKQVKEIWKMSNALYNNSIRDNDIAMSNYNALMKINKFCAEYLQSIEREVV